MHTYIYTSLALALSLSEAHPSVDGCLEKKGDGAALDQGVVCYIYTHTRTRTHYLYLLYIYI